MKDLSLCGYNYHDCHVLLTEFLPIAIRAIKPVYVKMVITQLCYFFKKISQKVIYEDELQDLQEFIGETVAQLEICFPVGFFDITEHLIIHMVDHIRALGPLYLHEMWTYERFMTILNRYVLNRAYLEGSMIEGYSTEEIIECCLGYLKDKVGIGLPVPRFLGRLEGVGTVGRRTFIDKDFKGVQQAHYSILQHLTIMTPLVNEHLSMIPTKSNGRLDDWIMREHKRRLTAWLKDLDLPDGETVEEQEIKRLQLAHLASSYHGKGIVLMDIYFILPQRTRRPCLTTVVFALRP
jgi:hypothetical protein